MVPKGYQKKILIEQIVKSNLSNQDLRDILSQMYDSAYKAGYQNGLTTGHLEAEISHTTNGHGYYQGCDYREDKFDETYQSGL